jgi:hypothetical protein
MSRTAGDNMVAFKENDITEKISAVTRRTICRRDNVSVSRDG